MSIFWVETVLKDIQCRGKVAGIKRRGKVARRGRGRWPREGVRDDGQKKQVGGRQGEGGGWRVMNWETKATSAAI